MLEIQKVRKSYRTSNGAVQALDDVSFNVGRGEFVAVQGPSGCGKTTLLLVIGALLQPDDGRVCIEGQEIGELSPGQRAEFRSRHIGFVFQQFHLIPYLNVRDNILAASLPAPAPGVRSRAEKSLARFGLEDRAGHFPAELSTGERQRVALARALLNRPKLVLADEPTGNLDSENATTVLNRLRECAQQGVAVLLVTHDLALSQRTDRQIRLSQGKLIETLHLGQTIAPSR
jgi:putative ABC transport system ATP-binding protein